MTVSHLCFTTLAALGLSISAARAAEAFSFADTPGQHLDILSSGRIVGRYMYAHDVSTPDKRHDTYKPYCHVFDAEGKAPITKGPGGSFTHHRGIYVGWNKLTVDGKLYDRWHMKGGDQVHEKFVKQTADAGGATFSSLVKWMGDGEAVILEEERTMTFMPPPAPGYAFIEVRTRLKAVAGETKLDGDPEHAGLQFRPANEVDVKETIYVFPKENADAHKDLDYPWFGETFVLGGKRCSVVYFNHPSNPRETRISAYRDYGRFGAFFRATIPKGGEQALRVRFLVSEGEMPSADTIQKLWNDFAQAQAPVPPVTVRKSEQKTAKPKAPAAPRPGRSAK